jgi:LuxR family maltose regulon positive regulatory protein
VGRAGDAVKQRGRAEHANSLLRTKIAVPQVAKQVVVRRRLLDQLNTGLQSPLTLLAAPAGFGKTMLLTSWIRSIRRTHSIAWYSLDTLDNDQVRFWTYVLESLRASGAVPRGSTLASLAAPRTQRHTSFFVRFLSGLTELRTKTVLILDDFHHLSDTGVLEDLRLLIRHDVPTFRLVVAARQDPDLPLSWVRLRGGMAEIRASDLAFTPEEAKALLADLDLPLSEQHLASLCSKTEGWAAGIRLAALSLQGGKNPQELIDTFGARDRALADYLVSEVLGGQSEEDREFLLQASIADTISGGLADAITLRNDSQRVLQRLERANAFVSALGSQGEWFRFHQLLVEFLRLELAQQAPRLVPELHRRAARWFVENRMSSEAIAHASMANDWAFAADVITDNWFSLRTSGNGTLLRDLLNRVPSHVVQERPELAIALAATLIDAGDVLGADEYLRLAEANESLVAAERRQNFAESMTFVRLYLSRIRGDLGAAVLSARQVLAPQSNGLAMGNGSDELRAAALAHLGAAEIWLGDFEAAAAHLEDGLNAAWRARLDYLALDCLSQLAGLESIRGRMRTAEERASAAIALAERRGWTMAAPVGMAYAAMAAVRFNRNEVAEAAHALDMAERANASAHELALDLGVALLRSNLLAASGETLRARLALRSAAQTAHDMGAADFVDAAIRSTEPRLLLENGDSDEVRLTLEAELEKQPSLDLAVELARLQVANGEAKSAIDTLKPGLEGSLRTTLRHKVAEAWLYDAVARHSLGTLDEASHSMEQALELAEPEGRRRVFVEAGPAVKDLLLRAIRVGTAHRSFVGNLLDDLEGHPSEEDDSAAILTEPLSDRERTVLRYLPTMLSSREIAAEMYLSLNTVKTHMKNIYRKLGASGRRDAVQRGRRLRLL